MLKTSLVISLGFFLLAGCDGETPGANGGTGGASGNDPFSAMSCGGNDPDNPAGVDCNIWTCRNVPTFAMNKTHCDTMTGPNPSGAPPEGSYSCPASGGGQYCPGDVGGGSGPWMCVRDEFTFSCDRTGPEGGAGGSGGGAGGPQFPGSGTSGGGSFPGGDTICFYPMGSDPMTTPPSATIEHVVETMMSVETMHIRVTLDPKFVDNTYGANSMGWPSRGGKFHTFEMLYKSDHLELMLSDRAGADQMRFKIDYISADGGAPSGYRSLGISGGDGNLTLGNATDVVATMTSIDRDLNERGYASYTVDSPATDMSYAVNAAAPLWDYRVVYEAWVKTSAFASGFGTARIESIHASPSKMGSDTIVVEPAPCPPGWVQ